jgi:4-amino-4-deoxy-L-arabinose transferase-like glycosyltransferase
MAVFFSVAGFYHTYYLSMLAPGVAALAAIGLTMLWRDYRAVGWHGYLLPAALVVTAIVQGVILADYTGWNGWMTPLIVGGSLLLAALLAWWRYAHTSAAAVDAPRNLLVDRLVRSSAVAVLATALGVALLLLGPATWVGVSLASGAGGTLPTAGPSADVAQRGGFGGNSGGPQGFTGDFPNGFVPGGPRNGGFGGFPPAFGEPGNGQFGPRNDGNGGIGDGGGAPTGGPANGNGGQSVQVNEQLLAYLEAHRGSARYLLATLNSQTAAPYIIASGQPVIALGGFSGSDQILSLSQLQALVSSGAIRYFLLDGGGGGFGGQGGGNGQLVSWVASSCTQVAASEYGGASSGGTLYACS